MIFENLRRSFKDFQLGLTLLTFPEDKWLSVEQLTRKIHYLVAWSCMTVNGGMETTTSRLKTSVIRTESLHQQ